MPRLSAATSATPVMTWSHSCVKPVALLHQHSARRRRQLTFLQRLVVVRDISFLAVDRVPDRTFVRSVKRRAEADNEAMHDAHEGAVIVHLSPRAQK